MAFSSIQYYQKNIISYHSYTYVFIIGGDIYNIFRNKPLNATGPHFIRPFESINARILTRFCSSPLMRSLLSFELDDACILPNVFNGDQLYFPQSIQLTHIQITLCYFEHCTRLLKQLDPQL